MGYKQDSTLSCNVSIVKDYGIHAIMLKSRFTHVILVVTERHNTYKTWNGSSEACCSVLASFFEQIFVL